VLEVLAGLVFGFAYDGLNLSDGLVELAFGLQEDPSVG